MIMSTATAIPDALQEQITSDHALGIARLDAEKVYRDLTAYRILWNCSRMAGTSITISRTKAFKAEGRIT